MDIPIHPTPHHLVRLSGSSETPELISRLDPEAFRSSEAYRIECSEDRKEILAASERALMYAQDSWRQWCEAQDGRIAHVRIEDEPRLARRGFMLDISRCRIPNRKGFLRWLDRLQAFRFNELQLYTEHSFAYQNHRSVWQDSDPITPEDLVWLRKECEQRQIQLSPNQNCFGHFERWLSHPEYRDYAECPEGFVSPWGDKRPVGSVLKPDDRSFALVQELLAELLPHFNAPRVNIGCDETFELGKGFSKDLCERQGAGRVYTDFLLRILNEVQEQHQLRAELWGDILLKHPEELQRLPPNIQLLLWGYEAEHPFREQAKLFQESGLAFSICPGSSSWNSFAGRSENMIANVQAAVDCALEYGADGLLLTDWGDNGHLQADSCSWPALAWTGLLGWNPEAASEEQAWNWADQVAFSGKRGSCEAWVNLGRVSERCGWAPDNWNAASAFFFRRPNAAKAAVSDPSIQHCLEHLQKLAPPEFEPETWKQARRLLELGFRRERHRRGEQAPTLLEQECREAQEQLWLSYSRRGGLAESLTKAFDL